MGISDESTLLSISTQFNGVVKYICKTLTTTTRFFALRPDVSMMEIFDGNDALLTEFLTRIDDFLLLHSKINNSEAISVDYWPTLANS